MFSRRKTIAKAKASRAIAQSGASRRVRPKHERSRHEKINRALEDHFPNFPATVADNYIPSGQTMPLRQALAEYTFPDPDNMDDPKPLTTQMILILLIPTLLPLGMNKEIPIMLRNLLNEKKILCVKEFPFTKSQIYLFSLLIYNIKLKIN